MKQLLGAVRVRRNVYEVFQFGAMDLFVFRSCEKCGDAEELVFASRHVPLRTVPINDVHSDVERLRVQAKLGVHFDQPRNEGLPHARSHFNLVVLGDAVGWGLEKLLVGFHYRCATVHIFYHALRVANFLTI